MRVWALWASALMALVGADAARADVKMSGTFVADGACPATQAIRGDKNPGNVSTQAGLSYELLAANKDAATHYLILGPGPVRLVVQVLPAGQVMAQAAAHLGPVGRPEAVSYPGAGQVDQAPGAGRVSQCIAQRELGPPGMPADPPGWLIHRLADVVQVGDELADGVRPIAR